RGEKSVRTLCVHALRVLAGGQSVLDDCREAILAISDLNVPRTLENVNGSFARHRWWARTESQAISFCLPMSGGVCGMVPAACVEVCWAAAGRVHNAATLRRTSVKTKIDHRKAIPSVRGSPGSRSVRP